MEGFEADDELFFWEGLVKAFIFTGVGSRPRTGLTIPIRFGKIVSFTRHRYNRIRIFQPVASDHKIEGTSSKLRMQFF